MSWIRNHWFPILYCFIAAVSLYDAFLVVQFAGVIENLEENPAGRWLIALGGGEVGVFVRVKLAGTLVVMTVLATLYRLRSPRTMPVTASLAAYQTGLLSYLTMW
ncbi:MAG: hypothetical protein RIK87_30060 [Fuerstiella sp.]